MKKGFTLIELLAVIVILAIIALIATPIVLSIISDSKESSGLRSAEMYLDAVEQAIMKENLNTGGSFSPTKCIITSEGNIECDETSLEIEVNGERPNGGILAFEEGNIVMVTLKIEDNTLTLNAKDELVFVKTLKDIVTTSNSLGVTSIDDCVADKTEGACDLGTPFAIEVNDSEVHKFYVIEDTGNEVTLIMNKNIYDGDSVNVAWYGLEEINTYGPITALEALQKRTSTWTNINEFVIDTYDDSGANILTLNSMFIMRSRLLTRSELLIVKEKNNGTIPNFLYENLVNTGDSNTYYYWLLTAHSTRNNYAIRVDTKGEIASGGVTGATSTGIRPVITILK